MRPPPMPPLSRSPSAPSGDDTAPTRPQPRSATTERRGDIQGLRAVAVVAVIAAHAGLPVAAGGYVGVDVFFVISGYLITQLMLRESDRTGGISLVRFYVRRARRILPAATVVLCVTLLLSAAIAPRSRLEPMAWDAGWSSVFLSNWHFAAVGTDYFASDAPSLFQHYWSLAVEEQFYLVWPLLAIAIVPRFSRRGFAIVSAAVIAVSLIWSLIITSTSPAEAYFNTPARAYELAIGALLACVLTGTLKAPWRAFASVAGVALIIIAIVTYDAGTPMPGAAALLPTLGAAMLLAAGPRAVVGRLLSVAPARFIGDISYSLYLLHWPVLIVVDELVGEGAPGWLTMPGAVVVAVVLAWLSYRYVELPFQHARVPWFRSGARMLWLWPASVLLVVAAIVGSFAIGDARQRAQEQAAEDFFASGQREGFTTITDVPDVPRELRTALQLADAGAPIPASIDPTALRDGGWQDITDGCLAIDGQSRGGDCVFGDPDAERDLAVIGDSHASMWLPVMDRLGRDFGYRVHLFAKVSCAPYPVSQPNPSMPQQECDQFREWTAEQLTALSPEVSVVTARGQLFLTDTASRDVNQQWSDAVAEGVSDVARVSDRTVVLGDIPTRPEPEECLSALGATQASCVSDAVGLEIDSNNLTEAAAASVDGAHYVDVVPLVCLDARCPLVVDTYATYQDDNHLATPWTLHLAPALVDEIGLSRR